VLFLSRVDAQSNPAKCGFFGVRRLTYNCDMEKVAADSVLASPSLQGAPPTEADKHL
jgi:hypothetical protein